MKPGDRCGAFLLGAPIGVGGMGAVFEATHEPTGRPAAVKVLTPSGARDDAMARALEREVRAVARLDHPRIVRVHDHGTTRLADGTAQPWFAMERATGTLADRDAPADWGSLRATLHALLDGLGHAHARGIVHCDVKAANVLVVGPAAGALRLTDFGLAHVRGAGRAPGSAGTPTAMAPEQFVARPWRFGPWTDLYALGCLVHRLASGAPPFDGDSVSALAHAHLYEPPPPLRSRFPVPDGLAGWVDRLLAKAPADRWRRAADARHALRALDVATADEAAAAPVELFDLPTALDATVPADTLEPGHPSSLARTRVRWTPAPMPASRPPSVHHDVPVLPSAGAGLIGMRVVPIVGRAALQDQLWQALHQVATDGRPRWVLLSGPAGVGKSALGRWLAEAAHEAGAAQTWRVPEGGLATMVARALGLSDHEDAADDWLDDRAAGPTARMAARAWAGVVQGRPAFDGASERYAALRALLAADARGRAIVLNLDDAGTDADVLAFARSVLDAPPATALPILMVATTRPAHLQPGTVPEGPRTEVLDVPPLDRGAMRELVRSALGVDPVLAAQLEDRAAGNPLFALHTIETWARSGALTATRHGLRVAEAARLAPASWDEVWQERLATVFDLDGPRHRAAEAAAALGAEVAPALWQAVGAHVGASPDPDLGPLLLRTHLAEPLPDDDGDGWRWAHGMVREALVATAQRAGRWPALQIACADALAAAGLPGWQARAGRHLLEAERFDDGLPLLGAAAERAIEGEGDVLAAQALLTDATSALERASEGAVARWRADHAWLEVAVPIHLGRADEADAALAALEAATPDRSGARSQAIAAHEAGKLFGSKGAVDEAAAALERALPLLEQAGETTRAIDAQRLLGVVLLFAGDLDRARTLILGARSRARTRGEDGLLARCAMSLAQLHRSAGDLEAAMDEARSARAAFEARGVGWGVSYVIDLHGELLRDAGRFDEAVEAHREAEARYRDAGDASAVIARGNMGLARLRQGRFHEAEAVLRPISAELAAQGKGGFAGLYRAGLLPCAAARGDWDEWDELLAALAAAEELVDPARREVLEQAVELALEVGEEARAEAARALIR